MVLPIRVQENDSKIVVTEDLVSTQTARKIPLPLVDELMECTSVIQIEFAQEGGFLQFINAYLKLGLTVEKTLTQKRLYMTSGQDQYAFFVEPLVIALKAPHFLEKDVPFAYQRKHNLHLVSQEYLSDYLEFLETKITVVERHHQAKPAHLHHQQASNAFNRNLRIASLLVLIYPLLLGIMWGTRWFYLLRMHLNLGYAVAGIYSFALVYFYYRFHLVKKEVSADFSMPYYQKSLRLEEAELVMLKEELSEILMSQFIFECLKQPNSQSPTLNEKISPIATHATRPISTTILPKTQMSSRNDELKSKLQDFMTE